MSDKPFNIFISHARKNKEIAERFYWLALTNQLSVWYDFRCLEAGENLRNQLKKGIDQSQIYLLFLTKETLESEFVQFEMQIARERVETHGDINPIVVKLSEGVELDQWWNQYFFADWTHERSEAAQLVPFLSQLIGRDPVGWITESSFLTPNPSEVFVNESRTVIEHARNAVLYYLASIKSIIQNPGVSPEEHTQTLNDLSQLALIRELPTVNGGWIPIRPGEIEIIHPVRMRKAPEIELIDLPSEYTFESTTTPIATRLRFIDQKSREQIKHPIPFAISTALDAEL